MEKVTKDDVKKIAHAVRIALSDEEEEMYANELGTTIVNTEKLNELNTDDVTPTTHGIILENVMREDEPKQSITQEEALKNAPDQQDGHFKVPSIMEQGGDHMSFFGYTIKELEQLLHKKELSAEDIVDMSLKRIKEVDNEVQAFLTLNEEAARAQAKALDASTAEKQKLFSLDRKSTRLNSSHVA